MIVYVVASALLVCGAVIVLCLWMMIVTQRTYKQRIKLIHMASHLAKEHIAEGRADFMRPHEMFDSVTFERHMWRVACMRDPLTLYPMYLQAACRAGS